MISCIGGSSATDDTPYSAARTAAVTDVVVPIQRRRCGTFVADFAVRDPFGILHSLLNPLDNGHLLWVRSLVVNSDTNTYAQMGTVFFSTAMLLKKIRRLGLSATIKIEFSY